MNNIKIAKEILRLAKMLVAGDKEITAYKLMKIDKNGHLHFPFADTSKWIKLGVWMEAEDVSSIGKDGRKTTLVFRGGTKGRMAPRPGFHCGDIPYAPHIGVGGTQQQHEFIGDEDVWVQCTLKANIDYQPEADANGMTSKGKINRQKADIRDHVPVNGIYRYKTNPNMKGTWIIGGNMRLDRILYDEEAIAVAKANGLQPMPREHGPFTKEQTDELNRINS